MSLKVMPTTSPKPSNPEIEDQIRRLAQELYEGRNPGDGTELDDWLKAEKEVLSRSQRKAAKASS